jgi:hypothetical protein
MRVDDLRACNAVQHRPMQKESLRRMPAPRWGHSLRAAVLLPHRIMQSMTCSHRCPILNAVYVMASMTCIATKEEETGKGR